MLCAEKFWTARSAGHRCQLYKSALHCCPALRICSVCILRKSYLVKRAIGLRTEARGTIAAEHSSFSVRRLTAINDTALAYGKDRCFSLWKPPVMLIRALPSIYLVRSSNAYRRTDSLMEPWTTIKPMKQSYLRNKKTVNFSCMSAIYTYSIARRDNKDVCSIMQDSAIQLAKYGR